MKEEQGVLRDAIGTDPQKEESKTKKYIRIIFTVIFGFAFLVLIVAAAVRKFGS